MLKKLHLSVRMLYTVLAILLFSAVSKINFFDLLFKIGWLVFMLSFLWQYLALHGILKKKMQTPFLKNCMLTGCFFIALSGILMTGAASASAFETDRSLSGMDFNDEAIFWMPYFISYAGMFVALACTYKVFSDCGQLE